MTLDGHRALGEKLTIELAHRASLSRTPA